MYQIEMRR